MMLIIVGLLFIILGILIKYAKMYYLLAGYNTMSKKEQDKYDIEGIASIFRNGMFGMAIIMFIGFIISQYLNNPKIEMYSLFIAIAIGLPYLLIKSNSKRFKKNHFK